MRRKHWMALLFVVMSVVAYGQTDGPVKLPHEKGKKQQASGDRQSQKAKQKQLRDNRRMEKKIRKRTKKIQSKETLKRMRKNKKKAKRQVEHKRDPFYIRWFRKGRN